MFPKVHVVIVFFIMILVLSLVFVVVAFPLHLLVSSWFFLFCVHTSKILGGLGHLDYSF